MPNIYQFPNTYIRGSLYQKIYELEKLLNLNGHFFSQAGQDKFVNDSYFRSMNNGFFVEIGAYN